MTEYAEIKGRLDNSGMKTNSHEWQGLVAFARRKAQAAGKDESYLPYLLPDVVKEYFFRAYINGITMARRAGDEI